MPMHFGFLFRIDVVQALLRLSKIKRKRMSIVKRKEVGLKVA